MQKEGSLKVKTKQTLWTYWVPVFLLTLSSFTSFARADSSALGVGTLTQSNQLEYERFEAAFYFSWNPLTYRARTLKSDNQKYQSDFDSDHPNELSIGVRHEIATFNNRFALLADYLVGVAWAKGTLRTDRFQIAESANRSNLLSLSLCPKALIAYFINEHVQPILGFEAALIYSRLQASLTGGDNEYNELHYGPSLGIQVLNLPFKQTFFSAEWVQFLNRGKNESELYADNGRAQISLGLNF